jgi:hypothetical protein
MSESARIAIDVDQIWEDTDPRAQGRRIRIIEVDPDNARARGRVLSVSRNVSEGQIGRRTRWIKFSRFRPGNRGYRLISNPVTGTSVEE